MVHPRTDPVYDTVQSVMDVTISLMALLVLLPVLAVIALCICLETPGPVLFKQKRVGKDGKEFWFYKFRSMVTDAEKQRDMLLPMNEGSGLLFKIKNDPRITRTGRFIRRSSLDELPQLLNILIGDMSLVGPRPALPAEVSQYGLRQRSRLSVKPGLTGLWQVSGRSDLPFDRSIELDLQYVAHRSIGLNVQILLMTIPAVFTGRGAY